jgi:hypothetical protein
MSVDLTEEIYLPRVVGRQRRLVAPVIENDGNF